MLLARFLRFFFRLLYQPFAWTYDFVAAVVSLGHWRDWVMSVLPYLPGGRVLELGFGPGHLQAALSSRGVAAFGVDASPQMASLTRSRLRKLDFTARITTGYAQSLPFPNSTFHQIVATFPPEFILAPETLREALRVLCPGGEFVVLPSAWITGKRPLEKAAAQLFRITGQAPTWDNRFLKYFTAAGFETHSEEITEASWKLLVIRARKPKTNLHQKPVCW